MRIKMLSTQAGADDGYTVLTYHKGEEYDVSDALANEFLKAKQAERPGKKKAAAAKDTTDNKPEGGDTVVEGAEGADVADSDNDDDSKDEDKHKDNTAPVI